MHRILSHRNCWTIEEVSEAGVFVDGHDYYRAFYHAARAARRYILISGWQFDSEAMLLRGEDADEADGDTRFIEFLNDLCERNPELEIYILAWDFSFIFMLEREWLQEWIFNWTTSERIRFRFEGTHPVGASQHQKFVVIDGSVAFIGGMDICAGRWDTRLHRADDPHRINPDGAAYGPYHEIQTYHRGPIALRIERLFRTRWQLATSDQLTLPGAPGTDDIPIVGLEYGLPIPKQTVALSRTQAATFSRLNHSITEIKQLFIDAIAAAEHLIYIENQYLSSCAVYRALVARMSGTTRPKLQIVILLPRRPQDVLEEIAVGVAQARILRSLEKTALETGHSLGIYYSLSEPGGSRGRPTYIHSKLLIIDDRFLTVGSANTTNRSLGLDVELNVSWEAESLAEYDLIRSIRRVRFSLLAELTGMSAGIIGRQKDLVGFLDALAADPESRLRHHTMDSVFDEKQWLKTIKPDVPLFDPERTLIEEDLYEMISSESSSLFAGGITLLKQWLSGRRETAAGSKRP
ncbi:MAG: phospholipase D-like domain-containing protein [Nitrospirota bacterium]